jgi:hypothetical protein
MTQKPRHFLFCQQVIYTSVDMGEAIYLLSGKVRGGRANVSVSRVMRPIVTFLYDPSSTLEPFVGAPHFFAADVDVGFHPGKSFLIFFKSPDGRLAAFLLTVRMLWGALINQTE